MGHFGWYGAASVVLLVLKVTGVIEWPWLVVLAPILAYVLLFWFLFWLVLKVMPWLELRRRDANDA